LDCETVFHCQWFSILYFANHFLRTASSILSMHVGSAHFEAEFWNSICFAESFIVMFEKFFSFSIFQCHVLLVSSLQRDQFP
jgi:hypothetical protein